MKDHDVMTARDVASDWLLERFYEDFPDYSIVSVLLDRKVQVAGFTGQQLLDWISGASRPSGERAC